MNPDTLLARRRAGESLVDAAARMGISREAVRRLENQQLWLEIKKREGGPQ